MEKNRHWLVQIFPLAVSVILATVTFAEQQPFWKAKPEIYKKIKEDREVVVSAKTEKDGNGKKMTLITAGRIKAPLDFTHKIATDYSKYYKILPYVDETSYDKETKNMFAQGSFMGFHGKMTLKLSSEELKDAKPPQDKIKFEVIAGFLTGMQGVITEERVNEEVTEISMEAVYTGDGIAKIPGFLIDWGFEFVGRKMASAMRSHVEEEWENE